MPTMSAMAMGEPSHSSTLAESSGPPASAPALHANTVPASTAAKPSGSRSSTALTCAMLSGADAIDRGFNQRYDRALDVIERLALEKGVALYRDSSNVAFTPMSDGKALDEAEFSQLPEADRERLHEDISELEERLNEELASLPQWKRESNNQLRQFNASAKTKRRVKVG